MKHGYTCPMVRELWNQMINSGMSILVLGFSHSSIVDSLQKHNNIKQKIILHKCKTQIIWSVTNYFFKTDWPKRCQLRPLVFLSRDIPPTLGTIKYFLASWGGCLFCRAFSRQFFPQKFWVKSESTPVFLSKNLSLERKIATNLDSRQK